MEKFSYLKSINDDYIDDLFSQYSKNPDSIEPTWRYFFEGLELGSTTAEAPRANGHANGHAQPGTPVLTSQTPSAAVSVDLSAEAKVADLINAYRELGRLLSNIDPLTPAPASHPLLELSRFELSTADLPRVFTAGRLLGMGPARLSDIIANLKETYCGSIGVEYTHIQNLEERRWLQARMESSRNRETLDPDTRKFIYLRLCESETFERFLHTRYVAQKRFSVEGGEAVIPGLSCILETGAELGAKEFVMGMAHRGRLNVLVNLFGKKLEYLFTEFEGAYKADTSMGEGDVKYHMGYSADATTRLGKKIHLSLASNPSHLEIVSPVAEGMARAKQTFGGDANRAQVVPVLIHGDASFAGQGVVYETLNLSQLDGYSTGGTIHLIVNNQIGFTTNPSEARSTTYSTDLAKMLEVPIFHVNGDDVEAVWYLAKLCTEYRQKFKKDIFIDLICYRKHGHNEGDEPSFTQPLLYKNIRSHSSARERYGEKLVSQNIISKNESEAVVESVTAKLTEAQTRTKASPPQPHVSAFERRWKDFKRATETDLFKPVNTKLPERELKEISKRINSMPQGFHLHPKLSRFFEARAKAVEEGKGIDWGNGEALAYASLVAQGYPVRISGQDAERGTFTHRHAVLSDYETGEFYVPLKNVKPRQASFDAYNSSLSEMAVMGFEFGYSSSDPQTLVLWEAQFGDFANGAQVVIDQFLASSESKWQRMSGLVLLLPHGFEGQGAEHSSGRLERFLQLCGKNNLFVCNFTTPAQIFHALRRQMLRDFRKPLVVMTPKSLLRHPHAISTLDEFTSEGFREVIDESDEIKPGAAKKVLLCSGKIYYDLLAERSAKKRADVAIIRVEQLYPWPEKKLADILSQYTKAKSFAWVQEEPRNMGAWTYVYNMWAGGYQNFSEKVDGRPIRYIGREVGAAPAAGSAKVHDKEQKAIVAAAFSDT